MEIPDKQAMSAERYRRVMHIADVTPPLQVYVIDDEPQVRSVLARLLGRHGFQVHSFGDAGEARTAITRAGLTRSPVDAVLLDMALQPGSSSTDDAEALLHLLTQRQPRPQVLLMSGQLSSDEFFRLVMRGAADFVYKPWENDDLLARVRECALAGRQKFLFHHAPHSSSPRIARDAFLSYSSKNDELALGLCRVLERMGVSTWYAPADVPPGDHWPRTLEAAIQSCSVFVVLLTEEALMSDHVMREVSRAFARREAERDSFLLVPVTSGVSPSALPEHLRELHAIALSSPHGLVDSVIRLADRITHFVTQRRAEGAMDRRKADRRQRGDRRGGSGGS